MLDPTPSQTIGPFFGFALPFRDGPDAVDPDAHDAIRIEGQLLDGANEPVPDGLVELWAGGEFVRCRTDGEGVYHFTVTRPGAEAPNAPHLNVMVFARGLLRQLATRIYFPDEAAANAADPALAKVDPDRRHTLIASPDGEVLRFDIHLQGGDETVFFSL